MDTQIMRGNTTARKCIEDFLSSSLPPVIDAAREQWELEEHLLPYPKRYDSYDILETSVFPTIGSIVSRTSDWRMVDLNNRAGEVYDATYSVRVFVWVRTPQTSAGTWVTPIYDTAMRLRDDMTALIRSAILHTPSLGRPDVCRVRSESLNEDYLDSMKGSSGASWLAGALLNFDMQLNEANYEPVLVEEVQSATVGADLLPR